MKIVKRRIGKVPTSKVKVGGLKMKIDVKKVFKTLEGKPMKSEQGKVLTLKIVAVNSLLSQLPDEKNLSGIDKVKRYKLSTRVFDAKGELEITSEQCTMIKDLVAKIYTPLIVGQAWEILDPAAVKEIEEEDKKKKS